MLFYLVIFVVLTLSSPFLIAGEARDALVNLLMKNCPYNQLDWAEKLLKTDAYYRLMEVASELNLEEFRYLLQAHGGRQRTQPRRDQVPNVLSTGS